MQTGKNPIGLHGDIEKSNLSKRESYGFLKFYLTLSINISSSVDAQGRQVDFVLKLVLQTKI